MFAGRDSTGVRGIRLAEGDSVISMAILRAVDGHAGRARGLPEARQRHARAASGEADEGEDARRRRTTTRRRGDEAGA